MSPRGGTQNFGDGGGTGPEVENLHEPTNLVRRKYLTETHLKENIY